MHDLEIQERFRLIEQQIKQASDLYVETQNAKMKSETIDVLIKIISAAFDKMSAYTSLIVIGGYVAFFSVWAAVEKFVDPWIRLWTFGFIGVSVLLFVLSETYRITKYSGEMQNWLRVLKNTPPTQFRAKQDELTKEQDQKNIERAKSQKVLQLVVTGLAVIGGLILFYGIGDALWKDAHKKDIPVTSRYFVY